MAPRAYWKGFLKLSLVSCPIALFPATSERDKISFHQLNRKTGNRIHYLKVDAETGDEVGQGDIVKGYETARNEYVELEPDELDAVALDSTRTIDIDQFVASMDIDEIYLRDPYFIVPDGKVGEQAFAVIREAIRTEGLVALGRVVFTNREHVIALEPRGKGLMGITLRFPYEIRNDSAYFGDIKDEKVPKDMLDLAIHIVETKKGKFQPAKFKDRYEDALKDLIRRKSKGEKIEPAAQPKKSNVIDLMDALRESVKGEGRNPPSAATHHRQSRQRRRSGTRARKAG